MRDAVIRALLNMYATSPRCLARTRCIRTTTAFKALSTAAVAARPRPRPQHRTQPRSSNYGILISRSYSQINNNSPRSVAVLGGGLTGLTTAWYLARFLPQAKIAIYEASDRLAGWIDSETVPVKTIDGEEGTVNFQRGARVLQTLHKAKGKALPRYEDLVFYELVAKLGLADKLQFSKEGELADRYIYYPDHLVRLPGAAADGGLLNKLGWALDVAGQIIQEPLYKGLIPSVANLMYQTWKYPSEYLHLLCGNADISVGHYWAARFGRPDLVDNVLSAMMHGIYGGDVWKLSMASSPLVHSLNPGFGKNQLPITDTAIRLEDLDLMIDILKGNQDVFDVATAALKVKANMMWLPDGLTTLTDRLIHELKKNPNVTIKTGEPVTAIRYHEPTNSVAITTPSQKRPISYHKVVSTLFAKTLAKLCEYQLPSLEKSTATTIQVVNLWYPSPRLNHPYSGFGYLIPQTVSYKENPECLLGVLFDSDREFVPDPSNPGTFFNRGSDTVHGTKLTVMMGGHYWDELPEEFLPDAKTAAEQAKKAVARHLGWPDALAEHAVASTKLCRECIPQHMVGHIKRMKAADGELEWAFKGKLAVVGGSYQTPGVLSSLRGARDIAAQISGVEAEVSRFCANQRTAYAAASGATYKDTKIQTPSVGDTGLGRIGKLTFAAFPKINLPLRYGSGASVDKDGNIVTEVVPLNLLKPLRETRKNNERM
ncbi:Protoporphyrinogen oxidase [Podospora fimiseda]|uniref:protoporphyrinogen oxidase n=1 Tax=Podospora fimiseda TaxID=252190 RepID=A0AAN6YMC6_9PEZI|nr:Protoporphyrinogen oxidase [Podospora fimiseda]